MSNSVDTSFDVYLDTPIGKDPDRFSPSLRRFHQVLWSKPLPDGTLFGLSGNHPKAYLHHKSRRGEFFLSSDAFTNTYRNVKSMAPVIQEIPGSELDDYFSTCSTIGAYIIFPSQRVDGKPTINGARGLNWRIRDRSDLTLECIRRYYSEEESPLSEVLDRYADFFELFGSFKSYVAFFLLQDLVADDARSIKFFLPFIDFSSNPLPSDIKQYRQYMERQVAFVTARNRRISKISG